MTRIDGDWLEAFDEAMLGFFAIDHADAGMDQFDRGWISFEDSGKLMISSKLPPEVETALGLNLRRVRRYGAFEDRQRSYLAFHREQVIETLTGKIAASPL